MDNGSPSTTIDSEEEQNLRSLINVDESLKDTLDSAISSIKLGDDSENDVIIVAEHDESNTPESNTPESNVIVSHDNEGMLSNISDEIVENLKKN